MVISTFKDVPSQAIVTSTPSPSSNCSPLRVAPLTIGSPSNLASEPIALNLAETEVVSVLKRLVNLVLKLPS